MMTIKCIEKAKNFVVNTNKNTITCILKFNFCVNTPQSYILDNFEQEYFEKRRISVAVAKCNEHDTFDVEKGKKIAYAKAKKEMFICLRQHLGDIRTNAIRFINDLEKEQIRFASIVKDQGEFVKSLDK